MSRFAALDTRFMLALAAGESDAEATIDYLGKTGFIPVMTESVFEQLGDLASHPESAAYECAKHACKWFSTWGILDPPNPHIQNGVSQINAERILEQGLIPNCSTIEAEILVEASCLECELLITFSEPLLKAPAAPLNLALLELQLNKVTVTIASPATIATRLGRMQKEKAGA
jgi:hypothetical protein